MRALVLVILCIAISGTAVGETGPDEWRFQLTPYIWLPTIGGTGSSDMTWSAMTELTRSFDWGDILFVYRHLEYDEDFDGLMQNFSFSGPAVGASFRF